MPKKSKRSGGNTNSATKAKWLRKLYKEEISNGCINEDFFLKYVLSPYAEPIAKKTLDMMLPSAVFLPTPEEHQQIRAGLGIKLDDKSVQILMIDETLLPEKKSHKEYPNTAGLTNLTCCPYTVLYFIRQKLAATLKPLSALLFFFFPKIINPELAPVVGHILAYFQSNLMPVPRNVDTAAHTVCAGSRWEREGDNRGKKDGIGLYKNKLRPAGNSRYARVQYDVLDKDLMKDFPAPETSSPSVDEKLDVAFEISRLAALVPLILMEVMQQNPIASLVLRMLIKKLLEHVYLKDETGNSIIKMPFIYGCPWTNITTTIMEGLKQHTDKKDMKNSLGFIFWNVIWKSTPHPEELKAKLMAMGNAFVVAGVAFFHPDDGDGCFLKANEVEHGTTKPEESWEYDQGIRIGSAVQIASSTITTEINRSNAVKRVAAETHEKLYGMASDKRSRLPSGCRNMTYVTSEQQDTLKASAEFLKMINYLPKDMSYFKNTDDVREFAKSAGLGEVIEPFLL